MKLGSKSVLTLIAAGILSIPMTAAAAIKTSHVDAEKVVITFEKSDVMSAEGRATIEREIRTAAKSVCGSADYSKERSLRVIAESRSCYHEAVTEALSNLGSGELRVSAR